MYSKLWKPTGVSSNRNKRYNRMHIGKDKDKCIKLKAHDKELIEVEEITYLGEHITSDGKNTKNLKTEMPKEWVL